MYYFENEKVILEKSNGEIYKNIPCDCYYCYDNYIMIVKKIKLVICYGDILKRKLPNGTFETYYVDSEPKYNQQEKYYYVDVSLTRPFVFNPKNRTKKIQEQNKINQTEKAQKQNKINKLTNNDSINVSNNYTINIINQHNHYKCNINNLIQTINNDINESKLNLKDKNKILNISNRLNNEINKDKQNKMEIELILKSLLHTCKNFAGDVAISTIANIATQILTNYFS